MVRSRHVAAPRMTAQHQRTRRASTRLLLLTASLILAVAGLAGFAVGPASATTAAEPAPSSSSLVTWSCTGSPCPWGPQTRDHAAVWPAALNPISTRHGYTTSAPVYAPGTTTAGYQVAIKSGSARIYAGTPTGSHRLIAALGTGETATLPVLAHGEVFSIQSSDPFTYTLTPGDPLPPPELPCIDPLTCDPVDWVSSLWRCDLPGCTLGDWVGGVITWPAWSAYASNARSGDNSRTVYDHAGNKLYPYMGPWADGCEVTAVTGEILVIEWERGTDQWRETVVGPGQTYTIDLVGPENGAMLETPNNLVPFKASFANCTPEPINPE